MTLLTEMDAIYVINLPHRVDRRAEIGAQLARAGLSLSNPQVHLFPAIRPDAPGPFPSIGARGCFMSHLGVLKDAATKGFETVLLLEDDADFLTPLMATPADPQLSKACQTCDMFYLGYVLPDGMVIPKNSPYVDLPKDLELQQAHSIVLSKRAIKALIPYLEAMLARPSGHPEGGPMHVDGAYCWFRKNHPHVICAAANPPLAIQRASQTDIHARTWKDSLPFIASLRVLQNRIRARRRG